MEASHTAGWYSLSWTLWPSKPPNVLWTHRMFNMQNEISLWKQLLYLRFSLFTQWFSFSCFGFFLSFGGGYSDTYFQLEARRRMKYHKLYSGNLPCFQTPRYRKVWVYYVTSIFFDHCYWLYITICQVQRRLQLPQTPKDSAHIQPWAQARL